MKKNLLQQLSQNQKFKRGASASLIALMLASTANSLSACDELTGLISNDTTTNNFYSENTTENTTSNPNELVFGQGSIFSKVKDFKVGDRDVSYLNDIFGEMFELEYQALPFTFLKEQGLVITNEKGKMDLLGTYIYEGVGNVKCNTRGFIDPDSPENDVYILLQYVYGDTSDQIYDRESNGSWVATYMLKYTLDDQDYFDFSILCQKGGDYRLRFFIQEMDKIYQPQVLSKSIYDYHALREFYPFDKKGSREDNLLIKYRNVGDYIESIDYENLTMTINYYDKDNKGIYSYVMDIKENPNWEIMVERAGGEEYVELDSYLTPLGFACNSCSIESRAFYPTEEQKQSAVKKYNLEEVGINVFSANKNLEEYGY